MRLGLLMTAWCVVAMGLVTPSSAFAGEPEPFFLAPIQFDDFIPAQERTYIQDVLTEEMGALFWLDPFTLEEAGERLSAAAGKRLAACAAPACYAQTLQAGGVGQFLILNITRVSRGVFQIEAVVMDGRGHSLRSNRTLERGGVSELKYTLTGFLETLFAADLKKYAGSVVALTVDTTAITSTEADSVLDKADEAAEAGRVDEAIALYEKGAVDVPTLALPYVRIARLKLARKDIPGTREAAQLAIRREARNAEAHLLLGEAEWQAGNRREAERALALALQLDPSLTKAAFLLGGLLAEAGRVDDALRAFSTAQSLNPDQPAILVNLGLLQMKAGRWAAARESLEGALRLDGGLLAAYPALAEVCEQQKDWLRARDIYLKLSESNAPCAACLFNAGRMSEQLDEADRAREQYARTIELDAGQLDAYYSLGRLEAARGACDEAARLLGHYAEREKRPGQETFVAQARNLMTRCTAR